MLSTDLSRRRWLQGAALSAMMATGAAGCATTGAMNVVNAMPPSLDELQERTFRWFWDTTNPTNGLTPDRWPTRSFCSIAAVGYALTVWPVAVERGWITREAARDRTLTTIRFMHGLPQGPEPTGKAGYKGFFYHFLDMETGHRFARCELSTVDTALLIGGMLFAAQWFDQDHEDEAAIRRLTDDIYRRIEWPWAQVRGDLITMGWHPETGFIASDWNGYNEGMLVIILALGSPTYPVRPAAWDAWTATYNQLSWTDEWGPLHLHFAPLFGHQYSHVWIDFRGIKDAYMRARGFDYFENSRRAAYAQQKYAIDNKPGWSGYSENVWGLTACDGPADFKQTINGVEREFFSYSARGPGDRDDGTIAPTAALGMLPFAPEIVVPCFEEMKARYGSAIYTEYGFLDSFNPTLTSTNRQLQHGRIVAGVGWVDGDYIGIDQGPIVTMIENHRNGMIWNVMRNQPAIRLGLQRAGFTGGWLGG